MRQRVAAARAVQLERDGAVNAQLNNRQLQQCCQLTDKPQQWLEAVIQRSQLSTKACHRMLKVAGTIVDLAGSEQLLDECLAETMGYRLRMVSNKRL